MIIHTVKSGENLYDIARKYSVPATKILGDNDLFGDRITVGDELIILIPTRTETVKAKDTLDSYARRFGLRKDSLFTSNPMLMGNDRLRPGQIITIKHDSPQLGIGSAVGIINKGTRRDFLSRAIPYATYISTNACVIENDGIKMTFDTAFARELCKNAKKIHLLGIKDNTQGRFIEDKSRRESIIDSMINFAKGGGYNGITLSAEDAAKNNGEGFCEFLLTIRKKFIGCDMLLFTEIFESTPKDASELSDGAILNLKNRSKNDSAEKMRRFASEAESSKVFIKMESEADVGKGRLSLTEVKDLCRRCGMSITQDEETLISHFVYTRYKTGKGEKQTVAFPSLKYTKAMLEEIAALDYMGIAFDSDTAPASILTMFSSSFVRADYSMPYGF